MKRTILLSVVFLTILRPFTPAQAETIRVELAKAALISFPLFQPERADWVRLEIDGNRVKLMHTTQVLDWFFGVYNWYDHPPKRVVFVPEGCVDKFGKLDQKLLALQQELKQGLIKEPEYEAKKKELVEQVLGSPETPTCSLTGVDTITLSPEVDIRKGIWTVDYVESNLNKSVSFKVPSKEDQPPASSLEKRQNRKR
ncbi:MAG: hypothetical protein WCA07_02655 [Gloeobacterales cyanobacterium]